MNTREERDLLFSKIIDKLKCSDLIEGIIQLGSGVVGYKDEYSDIDMMVAIPCSEDAIQTIECVHQCLRDLDAVYIKVKPLRDSASLVIAFLRNNLELNISIVPINYLPVKSPLWKILVDKTGRISEKMKLENERFNDQSVKYSVSDDLLFEFIYCMRKFQIELKRNNPIYALKMLETMREYTLQVEALNENMKLHQFKAYETLDPHFIKLFLETYPSEITNEKLLMSAELLNELFFNSIKNSTVDKALRTHICLG